MGSDLINNDGAGFKPGTAIAVVGHGEGGKSVFPYLTIALDWLVAQANDGEPETMKQLWLAKRETVFDEIVEDYQLGHNRDFDFDRFANVVSFIDTNLDRVLDLYDEVL